MEAIGPKITVISERAAPSPAEESIATASALGKDQPPESDAQGTSDAVASTELAAAAALAKATAALGHDVPEGTGPLYKCAICFAYVYESQLDHHVIICPDPSETVLSEGRTDGKFEGIAEEEPEELEEGEDDSTPATVGNKAEPAVRFPLRTGNADVNEKVDLAANIKESGARTSKRQQIMEELKRKEEEECTFQPKILPRGSPKTYTRISSPGESATWSPRSSQQAKSQRLKKVEAQVYADVTLKPKISRFAQAWSQKQQEDLPVGQPSYTVFERLYRASQNRDVQVECRALQDKSEENFLRASVASKADTSSSPGSPGLGASQRYPQPQRKIPTSELLYNDAIDRRERLKSLANQLSSSEEAERESSRVSGRSRRYYWQMLERQVKGAFDEATAAKHLLQFSALEDFLVRFGCMRPPREQQTPRVMGVDKIERAAAVQAREEESGRLRAALWRHLDPGETGHADLLTLTVFFHVLMGAVDEAAKPAPCQIGEVSSSVRPEAIGRTTPPCSPSRSDPCSPRSPPRSPRSLSEITASPVPSENAGCTPPGEGSVSHPTPVRSGSGGSMLAAIFEEEGHAANDVHAGQPGQGNVDAADNDDEGQRICELLVRFDPQRLRAEFQQLYLHRLHYQSQQSQMGSSISENQPQVMPEIDSNSRAMAEKLIERQRCESTEALNQHADLLLWRHNQVESRKENRRTQAKADEIIDCTFKPKMVAKAVDTPFQATPRGASRNEVLYARAAMDKERKEARAQEESKAKSRKEVRDCTFKPDTAKSERSYNRVHEAPVPRGFYETSSRLRAANEVLAQKRQQREERMCKITHVTSTSVDLSASNASVGQFTFGELPPRGVAAVSMPLAPVAEDSQMPEVQRPSRVASPSSFGSPRPGGKSARPGPDTTARSRTASPPPICTSPVLGGAGGDAKGGTSSQRTGSASARGAIRSSDPERHPRSPDEGCSASSFAEVPVSGQVVGLPSGNFESDGRDSLPPVPTFGTLPSGLESSSSPEDGSGSSAQPPLLYVDVNISPNQPPERIVLREGQSVTEVAADFAAKHVLTPALAQRLHVLLTDVLQKQAQHSK